MQNSKQVQIYSIKNRDIKIHFNLHSKKDRMQTPTNQADEKRAGEKDLYI